MGLEFTLFQGISNIVIDVFLLLMFSGVVDSRQNKTLILGCYISKLLDIVLEFNFLVIPKTAGARHMVPLRPLWCYQLRWPSGKSVRLGSGRLWFDSESGQTNDFKIGIPSFPA